MAIGSANPESILRESYCQLGLSSTSNKPKMVNARYRASWFVFVPHCHTLSTIIYPMLYSNLSHTLPYPSIPYPFSNLYHALPYPSIPYPYSNLYHTLPYPSIPYPYLTHDHPIPPNLPHSPNPISYPTSISCTNQPTYLVPYIVLIPIPVLIYT